MFFFKLYSLSSTRRKAHVKILSSWFFSDVPGKRGARENISEMMQAELQMSTELLYGWPSNTSGALYQRVTTCQHRSDQLVIRWGRSKEVVHLTTEVSFISKSYVLASPKSANLRCPCADTRMFCGFRSRCMMRCECRKSTPVNSSVANCCTRVTEHTV